MPWKTLLGTGLVLALVSCAQLPPPTPQDVTRAQEAYPGTTLASFTEARTTYVKTCSGCHALHLPKEYPAQRWPSLVNEMVTVQKVKLTEAERQRIEEFLIVMADAPAKPR
jgi:cytochrome c553